MQCTWHCCVWVEHVTGHGRWLHHSEAKIKTRRPQGQVRSNKKNYIRCAYFTGRQYTVKHYFFRRNLISWFPYVENSLHFNFADFPVNLSSNLFPILLVPQTNVIIEFRPILLFTLNLRMIQHIISRKSWYSMQTKWWGWAIWTICVYLIKQFYSNRETFTLTKYTCFTVDQWKRHQ